MKFSLPLILLCAVLVITSTTLFAGDFDQQIFTPSNMGTEFSFTFIPTYEQVGNDKLMLYISSTQNGYATVEVVSRGFKTKVVLAANTTVPVELGPGNGQVFSKPINGSMPPEQVYPGAGIHISSTTPCVVIAVTRFGTVAESFSVLPIQSLAKDYVIASQADMSWMYPTPGVPSEAAIVAAYNNTSVEFTLGGPSVTFTSGGMKPGDIKRFTMNKGDAWVVGNDQNSKVGDITGSFVQASKPVYVVSGNQCAYVPTTEPWCNLVEEGQFPIQQWGKHYLLPRYEERHNGYFEKVFSAKQNNIIKLNGAVWDTLKTVGGQEGRGWIYQRVSPTINCISLSATNAFAVTLLNPGSTDDSVPTPPFQMNVVPWEQFLNSFIFSTPGTTGGINFKKNYMGVVFPLTADDSIPADLEFGTSVKGKMIWQSFRTKFGMDYPSTNIYTDTMPNGSRYAFKECLLSGDGVYALRCSKPIMAYCYGGDSLFSYGHPAASRALNLTRTTDTIAPLILDTIATASYHGVFIDMPSDSTIRSNIAQIVLDDSSYNATLVHDPFEAGTTSTVGWRVSIDSPSTDAVATLHCSDAAGNLTSKTYRYIASDAIVPVIRNLKDTSKVIIDSLYEVCQGDNIDLICPNASIFRSIKWSTGDTTATIHFHAAKEQDTVISLQAISTTSQVHNAVPLRLRVHRQPQKPGITRVSNTLNIDTTGKWKAGDSFQWFFRGLKVPGATGVTFILTDTGDVTVLVTTAFGCSNLSDPIGREFDTSVIQVPIRIPLRLQPNPAKDLCTVVYDENTPQSVALYDLKGMLIRRYGSAEIPIGSLDISLEALPAGVYTVQLSYGTEVARLKLIKE